MVRRIVGSVAVAALVLTSAAQAQGIKFGPMVGVNLSSLNTSTVTASFSNRVGWAAGGFLNVGLGPSVDLGLEGYFSKGGSDITTLTSLDLNYIQIPGYIKLKLPLPVVTPFLLGGAQVGIQTSCATSIIGAGGTPTTCPTTVSSTDVSALAGIGVEVGPLIASLRYNFGLSDLGTINTFTQIKNRQALFLVGYAIKLGL